MSESREAILKAIDKDQKLISQANQLVAEFVININKNLKPVQDRINENMKLLNKLKNEA